MTLESRTLSRGSEWFVRDVICRAGPRDRPLEERHDTVCLAAVVSGSFRYRSAQGSALLVPGAVLLGNHGCGFQCDHEHGVGDRCLSFHFTAGYWEDLVAALPGARRMNFRVPRLPPVRPLIALLAALQSARDTEEPVSEEMALGFAGAVLSEEGGLHGTRCKPSPPEERRIAEALSWIVQAAHEPDHMLSVGGLARQAGMSPFRFLRAFQAVVGMTPHQYVLRTRMHRAAVLLRLSDRPISTIALEAGFNDLSTFNRRFRSLSGSTPGAYRRDRTKIPVSGRRED